MAEHASFTEWALRARIRAGWLIDHRGWPVTTRLATLRRATVARRQRFVVVTGSQGKTTTVRALRVALGLPDSPSGESSRNMSGSATMALLRQSPFRRHSVLEAGASGPGSLALKMRLFRPDVAVITSFGTEHHQAFPDLAALRDEKASVARLISPRGTLALNADDEVVAAMAAETRARVITFGTASGAGLRATTVRLDWPRGTVIEGVGRSGESFAMTTRLFGEGGVQAVLAALAVAEDEGVRLAVACRRLAGLRPTLRRLQPYAMGSGGAYALVDESKAPPEGMEHFLRFVRTLPAEGRKVFVLGKLDPAPGGSEAFYARTALAAAALADRVIVVGDSETQDAYRTAFAGAAFPADRLAFVASADEAQRALPNDLGAGDVVLLKATGKTRLGRIAIAGSGRPVRCRRAACEYEVIYCERCPLLEKGP